jgi:peptidylprolyl isomerase/FKBP-type peptidyl-prolyl cis-trans isomerase FklB
MMRLLMGLATLAISFGGCAGGNSLESNHAAAAAFLASNGKQAGVITLPDGLEYKVMQSGPAGGPSPTPSENVTVNYEARLLDGTVIDSSYQRGAPSTFQVGGLVPAWTEALQLMKPGDTWMLYAPPNLAYGDRGAGPVGPGSALVFKIELIRVLPEDVSVGAG